MSWKKIYAVIRREYIERVRTKAFWIGTLLVPIFFLGYIAIQVASFKKTGGERTLAVVDVTGHLFQPLQKDLTAREADLKTQAKRGQGVHWILQQRPVVGSLKRPGNPPERDPEEEDRRIPGLDPSLLEKSQAEYYGLTVSEFVAMAQLDRAINHVMLKEKIEARPSARPLERPREARGLENAQGHGEGLDRGEGRGDLRRHHLHGPDVHDLLHVRLPEPARVIEEKTSRIVEVIIASVRPTELMLGRSWASGRRPDAVHHLVRHRDEPVAPGRREALARERWASPRSRPR
jgi:ABC-2 type transport system permease protein